MKFNPKLMEKYGFTFETCIDRASVCHVDVWKYEDLRVKIFYTEEFGYDTCAINVLRGESTISLAIYKDKFIDLYCKILQLRIWDIDNE